VPLGIVVFARLDSRRLPGKALRDLAGRPLLGRVLDRLRAVEPRLPIVVATSDRALDDPIAAFAEVEGAALFRGAADDVLGRAHACAEAFGFSAIVRISGDSPFIDPALIERCVAQFEAALPRLDLVTNIMPKSFPPGVSVEVIATEVLRRMTRDAVAADEREHVTPYLYRNAARFRIENLAAPDGRYRGVSLTVDEPRDLDRAAWIAATLGARAAEASLDEIVALARRFDAEPEMEVTHGRA
jgi:spore coat polysaccharide biosynthesis protein SpsF